MISRPYQLRCEESIVRAWDETPSTLAVLATGTGKTVIGAKVIKRRLPARALFAAHRKELIWQAQRTIKAATSVNVEVEMGDYKSHQDGGLFGNVPVVAASVQTLSMGGDGGGRIGKFDPMEFDTLICDEAHRWVSSTFRKVIDYFRTNPNCKILGLTATPDRTDEKALGEIFESVAFVYEIRDAINDGYLVPVEQQMVTVSGLDFSGVKPSADDLNSADLSAVMEAEENVHKVVGPTIDICGDRSTLVFAVSVNQARMYAEVLNRHRPGSAAYVCATTDEEDRAKINRDFDTGKIQFLCNCGTHTEGYDSPIVKVIVMGRPTESRLLYAQMAGRGTRPLPGIVDGNFIAAIRKARIANSAKPSCLIVDFVGNSGKHKLVTTADILGGNVSEAVLERAAAKARELGRPVRMDRCIEEEEKIEAEREKRRQEEEARRLKLTAKAKFSTQSIDPFNVLQIKPVVSRGWDSGKTLSEKQSSMLRKQNINPHAIPYAQAKQIIGVMMDRMERGLSNTKQVNRLQKYGINALDMTFAHASACIDAIAKNGWRRPAVLPSAAPIVAAPVEEDNVPF